MAVAAEGVGDAQGVCGAVHAGSLAVPHAKHAIDLRAGVEVELLRAGQEGDRQILVQPRLEFDVVRLEQRGAAPKLLVQPAERRAAIPRYQSAGAQPGGRGRA